MFKNVVNKLNCTSVEIASKYNAVKANPRQAKCAKTIACAMVGTTIALTMVPSFAFATSGGTANLPQLLQTVANTGAILCTFAAIVLFAMGKLSDTQGARGEAMMIGCAMAAVAFFAASAYIATQSGSLTSFGS